MDEKRLKEIGERLGACQPGPWTSVYKGERSQTVAQQPPNHYGNNLRLQIANCSVSSWGIPNADFIAHARQDIPALLAEVMRLRMALEDILHFAQSLEKYTTLDIDDYSESMAEIARRALGADNAD